MSIYPIGYPEQRLIVNNVDLTTEFQMVLIDGFDLQPPEPKYYKIDIPGGNGEIDLTEALGGDVAFKNRTQRFTFKTIYNQNFETIKTKVSNFLHGRYFPYSLNWDLGYEYRGRFSVIDYSHIGLARGKLGEIVIEVTADPYKYKNDQIYKISAIGGEFYYFPSGRKPVRPVVQTNRATTFTWNGHTFTVGIGTYRLNDVLFTEGVNELYINSYKVLSTKWSDVGRGGAYQMTWDQAKEYWWDKFQRITIRVLNPSEISEVVPPGTPTGEESLAEGMGNGRMDYFVKAYTWRDISDMQHTWTYLNQQGWTWDGIYNDTSGNDLWYAQGDGTVYLTFEWGDL